MVCLLPPRPKMMAAEILPKTGPIPVQVTEEVGVDLLGLRYVLPTLQTQGDRPAEVPT